MKLTITNDFDLNKIADSGQCFRWQPIEDNGYRIIHGELCLCIWKYSDCIEKMNSDSMEDKFRTLYEEKNTDSLYILDCTEDEYNGVWSAYLDMEEEYADNITYYVTTTDGTTIRTAEDTYSGIIDLNSIDNGDVATLRIVVEWVDNGSYNESDTALGLENNSSISIPAQINVVQYLGETIEEYSSSSE